jgi:hypothetical protein
LIQHIEKGRPLIVALRPGSNTPLHYAVVAGIDPSEEIVLLNDPARRKLMKEHRRRFESQWSDAKRWTLLALPQPASRR